MGRVTAFSLLALCILFFAIPTFAQTPEVVTNVPAESFVGEQFCYTATITNTGNPGFGPYLRVVLDPGLTFQSANFLSVGVNSTVVGTFPPSPGNQLVDPITGTTVTGPQGGSFIVIQLPIGSVVTGGPLLNVQICIDIDTNAAIGVPLNVTTVPVYRFGDTPTGANGPIFGAPVTQPVTPTIVIFTKTNNAPESERTPGPDFPYTYTLNANIANAQTITNLIFNDTLPSSVQFIGPITITGGSGCSVTSTPSTITPGGLLTVQCTSATGTTAASDVSVAFPVHIIDILNESNCNTSLVTNNSTFDAQMSGGINLPQSLSQSDVSAKHLAIQKGVSPGSGRPGDLVTYIADFQVTDFGTASSLVITDLMPDGIAFTSHLSLMVNGVPFAIAPSVTVDPNGDTIIVYNVTAVTGALNPGTTGRLTYAGTIQQSYLSPAEPVRASDTLTNTINAVYDMTAGATGCSDGSGASVEILPVIVTKSIVNPQSQYAPGDVVTFRLEMQVPSGDTRSIIFEDFFPLPAFDVTTIDLSGAPNLPTPDIRLAPSDTLGLTPASITINAATNSLRIAWPDVITTSTQTIGVDIDVIVTNIPFADELFLTNLLQVSTENTPGEVVIDTEPVFITVRAPDLRLTKGIFNSSNATAASTITPSPSILPVDGNISASDSGDQVTYIITVENVGGAQAFNLNVTDSVPASLTGCGVVSVTDGSGASLATSGDLFGAGLTFTNPLEPNDEDPAGGGAPYSTDTALITVVCTIASSVQPGQFITNLANVSWTSEGGTTTFPAQSDGSTITIASPTIAKIISNTSEAFTLGNNGAIGEQISYSVSIRIPEGTSQSVVLTDVMDAGLSIVSLDSINASPGLSTSHAGGFPGVLADAVIGGGGTTVSFPFDTITNSNTNDLVNETIVINYTVVVSNIPAAINGALLNNNANWNFTGGSISAAAPNITVVEPVLNIAKARAPASGDAGNVITYTVTINHLPASTTDAFDLLVTDALHPQLVLNVGSVSAPGGTVITGNTAGDTTIEVRYDTLPLGNNRTITYQATIANTVPAGSTITNVVNLGWNSLPADGSPAERNYTDNASAVVNITAPSLIKAVFSTSEPATTNARLNPAVADLAIGEQVTFRVTATLPEGVTTQVIIRDTMPSSAVGVIELLSASIFSVGANLTPTNPNPIPVITDNNLGDGLNDTVVLDFGQTTNAPDMVVSDADRIIIDVVGRVVNRPSNMNTDVLTNSARIQFGPGLNQTATRTVEIVEPLLNVDKSSPTTNADAGDVVTYTVRINHLAASNERAFDLVITDSIPADMVYVPGSLISTGTVAPTLLSESSGTITAQWDFLPIDGIGQFQFQATIIPTVVPGQVITNVANAVWDTLSFDVDPQQRILNDSDDHPVLISSPGIAKTVLSTSEPTTGSAVNGPEPDVTIGERIVYRLTVTFVEGITQNATVQDQLPTSTAVFSVLNSTIVSVGGNLSGPFLPPAGTAGVASDTNADTFNDRVDWNLGNVTNVPDGLNNANDEVVFEVEAVVVNQPQNTGGDDDVVNTATVAHAAGNANATALVDVVEPLLSINKTPAPDPLFADAGDVISFNLQINHIPASTADAFNVTINDFIPSPAVSWINDGTVSSNCPGLTVDSTSAPNIVFNIPTLTRATGTCTISYQVQVGATVQPGQTFTNVASMFYDSTPVFVNGQTRRSIGSDSAEFTIFAPSIVKITQSTSLSDTGSTFFNPADFDLAIGELADYTITVIFPEGQTQNAVITDITPSNPSFGIMEAVGATIISLGTNISTSLPGTPVISDTQLGDGINDTISFDFGTVTNAPDGLNDENDRITLRVTARVMNVPSNANGDSLSNLGRFNSATTGVLTDTAEVDLVEPLIAIDKSMGPAVDGVVTITVQATNNGTSPAYDVEVQDILNDSVWNPATISPVTIPSGFVFTTVPGPGAGDTTVLIQSDSGSTPPANSIEPGEAVAFIFSVALANGSMPPSPVTNTATNTITTTLPGSDANEREEPDVFDTAQLSLPILDAFKSGVLLVDADLSGTISPGDTLRYTISVTNSGGSDANNVLVNDTPDSLVTLIVGSVTTSAGGSVIIGNNPGDTSIQVSFASIAPSATATLNYDVILPAVVSSGVTQIVNQAVISSDELVDFPSDDPNTGTNDDPTIIVIDAAPDLSITKSDGGISVTTGNLIPYTINYQNNGNQDATGVVITETVPANTVFNSGTPGWNCSPDNNAGSICTFTVGNLAANANGSILFTVQVNSSVPPGVNQIDNTVSIADDGNNGADQNPNDNSASDSTPLTATPDLQISKDDQVEPVNPGDTILYNLAYTNVGNQGAAGVEITDTVPAFTTFNAAASTSGWVCVPDNNPGSVCTIDIGIVQAGGNGTVVFAVTVNTPLPLGITQVSNTASINDDGSNGPDPTPQDNTSSDTTAITVNPALAATKADTLSNDADSSGDATTGDTLTYTVVVTNSGDVEVANVLFNDAPDGNTTLIVGTVTTSQGTVTTGNGAGDTTITVNIGNMLGGAVVNITFQVLIDPLPAGVTQVANQGIASGDTVPGVPTDDPDTVQTGDPTITPIGTQSILEASKDDALFNDADNSGGATAGDTLEYSITIDNIGNTDATNVVFNDTPGAETSLIVGSVTTSAGTITSGNNSGDTSVTVNVGTVTPADVITITFRVLLSDPLPPNVTFVSNQGLVTSTENPGGEPTDDPETEEDDDPTDTPIQGNPLLDALKSDFLQNDADGDGLAGPGDTIRYVTTLSNVSGSDATNVLFTDTPDNNTSLIVGSVITSQGSVTSGNNGGDVSVGVNVGTVMGGDTVTIVFDVLIDNPLPAGTSTIANQGTFSAAGLSNIPTDDPDTGLNDDPTITPLASIADLFIVKDDGITQVAPGEQLTYTITVGNSGYSNVIGAVVTDTFPVELTNITWTCTASVGSSCAVSGSGNILDVVNVLASGTLTYTVNATSALSATGSLTNTATVTPPPFTQDPNTGNNSSTDIDEIIPEVDLALTKTDSPDPIILGNNLTYTIAITNNGPSIATNVVATDTLPANVNFVSANASQGSCSELLGTVTCNLGSINPGSSATITILVTPMQLGVITNSASVTANEVETNPADNTDTEDTTVSSCVDTAIDPEGEFVLYSETSTTCGTKILYYQRLNDGAPVGNPIQIAGCGVVSGDICGLDLNLDTNKWQYTIAFGGSEPTDGKYFVEIDVSGNILRPAKEVLTAAQFGSTQGGIALGAKKKKLNLWVVGDGGTIYRTFVKKKSWKATAVVSTTLTNSKPFPLQVTQRGTKNFLTVEQPALTLRGYEIAKNGSLSGASFDIFPSTAGQHKIGSVAVEGLMAISVANLQASNELFAQSLNGNAVPNDSPRSVITAPAIDAMDISHPLISTNLQTRYVVYITNPGESLYLIEINANTGVPVGAPILIND